MNGTDMMTVAAKTCLAHSISSRFTDTDHRASNRGDLPRHLPRHTADAMLIRSQRPASHVLSKERFVEGGTVMAVRRISRRGFAGVLGAGAVAGGTTAVVLGNSGDGHGADEKPFEPAPVHRSGQQPNFLLILADDLGWGDLSSYGSPSIRTPHLDRLARSGLRFTDAYAASSVCSPTRFGLYTGRYPGRLRGGLQEPIGSPDPHDGIPLDHPTLASLLKGAGYTTAMLGKWHCGYLPWFSPTRLGWDEFFGNFAGGLDYFSKVNINGDYDLYEDEVTVQDLRYYTDILGERAADFLRRDHSAPWLLNLNFTTPHWPWEGPEDQAVSDELARRIQHDEDSLGHATGGSLDVYRTMVEHMDATVGSILEVLAKTGQAENTVVWFASDNGGERFSYVWPLTGEKFSLNEGGIRVPTLLSWPGTLPGRRVSHEPVVTMDWTATFLDLAGARPATDYPLDGVGLAGYLLDGHEFPHHDLFWRMDGQAALRRGNLKYLRIDPEDGDREEHLYDLAVDLHEQADQRAVRDSDLRDLADAWDRIDADLLPYT
jgi:arylsulfatase A-like enzyme